MKQAMGDLNMTVIVVVIIALLSFFFFTIIWPMIQNNFARNTRCDEAICSNESNGDGSVDCYYYDNNGRQQSITCAWKG